MWLAMAWVVMASGLFSTASASTVRTISSCRASVGRRVLARVMVAFQIKLVTNYYLSMRQKSVLSRGWVKKAGGCSEADWQQSGFSRCLTVLNIYP